MACLYAAMYPERTIALALFQPAAHQEHTPQVEADLRSLREGW